MTEETSAIPFALVIDLEPGSTPEELDEATRQLLDELAQAEVESAHLAPSGPAPEGSKTADPVTVGAIVVLVLPTLLPKLVDFVQAWALRGQGRVTKFKGKVAGHDIEFEGTGEELKAVLATLAAPPSLPGASDPGPAAPQPG